MRTKQKPIYPTIDIEALNNLALSASSVIKQARSSMLAPESRKSPPVFNSTQLGELCGLERAQVMYHAKKGELPSGDTLGVSRREWSLEDARVWVRNFRSDTLRDPEFASGITVAVANYKGGVSKTTTAAALSQGLSLRGHRVLVIDTDPQGSLTTLFGVLPDTEVESEQTILSLCTGEAESIMPAIQKTYWDGIDLVAAAPILFNAEFLLPSRQANDPDFAFWRVLDSGLEEARNIYDVIIIDTPPSLSYITINALIAADGVLMPLPPNALDFASSAQFWSLFTGVCSSLFQARGETKQYSFVDILLSRVDKADLISNDIRNWIVSAYGPKVMPVEIPKTSIAASASAEFGTVYDMQVGSAQAKTLKRAHDAYEQLVDYVEKQIWGVWEANAEAVRKTDAMIAKGTV
jgi:chromosome partitioning protein